MFQLHWRMFWIKFNSISTLFHLSKDNVRAFKTLDSMRMLGTPTEILVWCGWHMHPRFMEEERKIIIIKWIALLLHVMLTTKLYRKRMSKFWHGIVFVAYYFSIMEMEWTKLQFVIFTQPCFCQQNRKTLRWFHFIREKKHKSTIVFRLLNSNGGKCFTLK